MVSLSDGLWFSPPGAAIRGDPPLSRLLTLSHVHSSSLGGARVPQMDASRRTPSFGPHLALVRSDEGAALDDERCLPHVASRRPLRRPHGLRRPYRPFVFTRPNSPADSIGFAAPMACGDPMDCGCPHAHKQAHTFFLSLRWLYQHEVYQGQAHTNARVRKHTFPDARSRAPASAHAHRHVAWSRALEPNR